MQLGCSLPVSDIGTGPTVLRDYAQAAEQLGYAHLVAPDHVLGANPAADHGERRVGTTANAYHDPFVLFGFLAGCTRQIGFAVGVLILAQRQAALVAKQAASLDVLCGGRFRLGIGVGWNEVEFIGLNENFHNRGRRSEEQVWVMQRCGPNRMSALPANSIISKTRASIRAPLPAACSRDRAGGVREITRDHARGGTRLGGDGPRGVGFPGHRRRGRLAPRDRLLESGRGPTCDGAHDLCKRP